jgi:pimeloyl-ACP methyl ester carboxylesterase
MSVTCVFFGGFHQSELDAGPNAFSAWIDHCHERGVTTVVLNMRMGRSDSLSSRWRRFNAMHHSLWSSTDDVFILGYSMGCHLAVKFAAETEVAERVSELSLIAPDPKFRPNVLDAEESAYEQAKELWDTDGYPGDSLCLHLNRAAAKVPTVHILYSPEDEVASWEGNAEIMMRKCDPRFHLSETAVGTPAKNDWFQVQLEPSNARGEFWIHEQLFSKLRKNEQSSATN